jgi:glycosyltransferase involved in cell wall biosynthesis
LKILVNAVACRVAGGRAVALNFLRGYREGDFAHELVVLAPADCGYEEVAGGRVRVDIAPTLVHRSWARPWADHVWMRRVLAAERPDVVFAMGSIAYPTTLPQLVLFHWPYAIYPEPEVWERMSPADRRSRRVRRWLFGRRVRFASHFAAQTETARARLSRSFGIADVSVVPNAVSVGAPPDGSLPACWPAALADDERTKLLCLTRYYPHKNLEVLVDLGRRIREESAPFVVLLTLGKDDGPAAAALLRETLREGLSDVIVNLGTVPMEDVPALHRACGGLILPTVLESFSGTYVESMHFERPVFTSDRDFARDVCGDAAWYFDPHAADDILRTLRAAFDDPEERERRVALGSERSKSYPSWPEVTAHYVALLEEVADGSGA